MPEQVALGLESERSIRHILVCLDRSPLAEACIPHARSVGDAFGARITLLTVLASPGGDQPSTRPDALDWEISRRESDRYLTRVQAELEVSGFAREQVRIDVTQGRPAERIVTLARETAADLTVLGSQGEGGSGAWSLGSTAQQVLALAPGSVLVVPPDPGSRRSVPPKRIIVGVDGSLRTQSVLPEVARLAQFHDAQVVLVHIVGDPKATGVLSDDDDLALAGSLASRLEVSAEAYLLRLRERFFADVSEVKRLVLRQTDERRALLDAAVQREGDLLVLSAHGATCDAERPFGSVTAYALSQVKLPLLVLQDLPLVERESYRPTSIVEETPSGARGSFAARPPGET